VAPADLEVLAARLGLLIRQSKYDEAVQLCTVTGGEQPSPDVLRWRARVWEAKGDLAKAAEDYQRIIARPDGAAAGTLALGRMYYRQQQFDKAAQVWRDGIKLAPNSLDLRGALAEVLIQSNDEKQLSEARTVIDRQLAETPDKKDFQMLKADTFLVARNYDEAARLYQKVIEQPPRPAPSKAFARLAEIASIRNDSAAVMRYIEEGLKDNPKNATLLMLKANLALAGDPAAAVELARRATEIEPANEAALLLLSRAMVRAGSADRARDLLKAFVARAGTQGGWDARLDLARLCVEAADYDAAGKLLAELEARQPGSEPVAVVRVLWYGAQKQWPQLVEFANGCLKSTPKALGVADAAGQVLLDSRDDKVRVQCMPFFEYIVQQAPQSAEAHSRVGIANYQLARMAEARKGFEAALAIDPRHVNSINNLGWLLCEDLKDPAAAEKLVKDVVAELNDPFLWDTVGVIRYRLGRVKEAQEAFEKALAHKQVSVQTRQSAAFHLARLLAPAEKDKSLKLLNELLASDSLTLSAAEQQEARKLRESLGGSPVATKAS
jgi:tetratricopeptide (TPR) repeat protein